MRFLSTIFTIIISISLCVTSTWAQKIKFETQLRSSTVHINEPIFISFTIQGSNDNIKFSPPDLSNFKIISGPNQSNQQSIFLDNNGNFSQENSISFNYILQAKKTGNFTIKGATIRQNNGQTVAAKNATIRVIAHNSNNNFSQNIDDHFWDIPREEPREEPKIDYEDLSVNNIDKNIFIKAEIDKQNVVVGEQVNVIYKLYSRYQMLMNPESKPSLNGFWTQDEPISEPNLPYQENYNGKRYQVFNLRKVALFPQRSGTLTIDAIKTAGWLIAYENNYGEYFPSKINKELVSKPINIEVKDLPESNMPYTGAVGKFNVSATIDKQDYSTDDIIQLKLNIDGEGNLGLISAPQINLPSGLNTVNPTINDNIVEIIPQLSGQRQFVYNIAISDTGDFTIPSIAFTYFDPVEKNYKTVTTQEQHFHVKKGNISNQQEDNPITALKDINSINTQLPQFDNASKNILSKWYFWLVIASGPLLILINKLIKNKESNNNQKNTPSTHTIAWQRLGNARLALQNNNNTSFYEEISKAIWLYLSDKLHIPMSTLNKEVLKKEFKNRNINTDILNQTMEQIEACEMALYTPINSTAQNNALHKATTLINDFEKIFK